MSFGASPSDIIIVVTFCKTLYRRCRDAGGEYDEISREVRGLHTVVRHLKYEVEAPESPLNRDHSLWSRQLAPIIGDCDYTLRQLDDLLQKYGRLADGDRSPSSPRVLWDKVRFGSNEMDQLGAIRVKLISHKTSLTLFLDTIQLHESGKMAVTLDNQGGQLDVILDKVDSIASRMGQKPGSVMTSYDDDDKEVWKQFRRELVAEGFSSSVLQQHKDVLRAYIREIDQKGLLDETPLPGNRIAEGVNPERWLDSVQSNPSEDAPPSFDSLNTSTDSSGTKEVVIREENMKFPQSIKLERMKPQLPIELAPQPQLGIPRASDLNSGIDSQRQITPVPIVTAPFEKEIQYYNTSGSSDENSETDSSSKKGTLIRTSDLIASSQALQIRVPGSPSSFRSQSSFGGDDDVRRSIAYRPKEQPDFGSSPPRSGAIPIPAANSRRSSDQFGTSPRPAVFKLAPDSLGNEIPADAKWTKIARRLVSPEVLYQDRRRYEARPDFVAVLGVLSRDEIEEYAVRSQILRDARARRHQPPPPPQPPRPAQRMPERKSGRDTPSTEEDDDSSDSSHHRRRQNKDRRRSYAPSNVSSQTPRSGYPNPYGAKPPPSPLSPPAVMVQPVWTPQQSNEKHREGENWAPTSPQAGQERSYHPHPPKDRHRDHSRRSHRSTSRQSTQSKSNSYRDAPKNRGWKDNLAAAGIGGAAASLLNVLTEAAEGL